ncbi:decaprenyl-diphosphate synthase subunit 1 [Coprinopsis cinerea AmutBmut pab1-1]|nr:decaprenyl-diphosphate synthase subunit 1 [Coprinopsis cinerea AmutBmut pab1-1]
MRHEFVWGAAGDSAAPQQRRRGNLVVEFDWRLFTTFGTMYSCRNALRRLQTRRWYSTKGPDPVKFVEPQLNELRTSLLSMLGSGHAAISEITKLQTD